MRETDEPNASAALDDSVDAAAHARTLLQALLFDAAGLLELQCPGTAVSVLVFDPERGALVWGAAPSLPPAFVRELESIPVAPMYGSCGTAAYLREAVVAEDIVVHPSWANLKEVPIRYGFRASWSAPILSFEGVLLGTVGLYRRDAREPDARECSCVAASVRRLAASLSEARGTENHRTGTSFGEVSDSLFQIASGIAHDLRGLTTVIGGYTDMLLDATALDDPARSSFLEIARAAERCRDIGDQLLSFTHRGAGAPGLVDVNRVVLGLRRTLARTLGEKVQLSLFAGTNLSQVRLFPGELEQILLNLFRAIARALPRGGLLSVQLANVEQPDGVPSSVCMRLLIVGEQVDYAALQRLASPRSRADASVSRAFGANDVVLTPDARLVVRVGATEENCLALYMPAAHRTASRPMREAHAPARGTETIVVLDEDVSVRRLLGVALGRHGYTAIQARDSQQVLSTCEGRPDVALVLADLITPGPSRVDMVKRLLRSNPGIILLHGPGAVVPPSVVPNAASRVVGLGAFLSIRDLMTQLRSALDAA